MTKGHISERGNLDSLMKDEGVYAKLARIENTTFIEESFEKLSI